MDQITPDPTEHYGDEFDSPAEWFGARYKLRGSKALKTTLNGLVATGRCHRELLWEPAAELMLQGMTKPAIMVRDASLRCPSLIDVAAWQRGAGESTPTEAGAQRRIAKYRSKAEPLLQQAGLGLDWLGEEELGK